MRRYIFLVTLLLGITFSSHGQVPELINNSDFRPDAQAAIDSIYNFNFDGADERLAPWKKKHPDHPLWMVLDGIEFWWKVLSDLEDTSHDKEFVNIMKRVDYQAGKLLHDQPSHADGLIVRAISNGYLARHNANRNNWLTSMNFARKALNAYNYLRDQQPDLADLKLAEGLKLYYTAYLPEEYPIVKTVSWAMPSGNKEKGIKLIREASEKLFLLVQKLPIFWVILLTITSMIMTWPFVSLRICRANIRIIITMLACWSKVITSAA